LWQAGILVQGAHRRIGYNSFTQAKGMPMTLTLTPNTEAVLQTLAARHGQAPEAILEILVMRAAEDEQERQETLSGLRQSAEEFAVGRWTTPQDLDDALRARRP